MPNDRIYDVLHKWAELTPNAAAITAPNRSPLTYDHLRHHVDEVVKVLIRVGLSRGDRIAIVLPNGPELAVSFLAVSSYASSAPLNPAYRATEFDFYLSDLCADALIIQSGLDCAAIAVAQARGLPIIQLSPDFSADAGIFTLTSDSTPRPHSSNKAELDDVALLLHTSGTTARPKLVPLTQANLCVSAEGIATSLGLSPRDCCLNIMPLFHIHGLVGAVLSSLVAGASVVCTPGFDAVRFFEWMKKFRPTWYTAVPTMHQGILGRARIRGKVPEQSSLRFIRSCSAPLVPQLMTEIEEAFGVPVVEAYGMTEASHQIAINPLPPGSRKPGSVGVATNQEVGIMDNADRLLPPNTTGEIVIRGPNVTCGYENNLAANQEAFVGSWFRTGDQGFLDPDGYLFINGRIKEIINRGGEKISPREVDEVLLAHPAVEEAMTFAVPDTKLGQDIGAAVVLRRDQFATEIQIQEFVATRLADFKVPHRIITLDELPKGPTGKPQRSGMARKLGLADLGMDQPEVAALVRPLTRTEALLSEIWSQVLRLKRIDVDANFFHLGGDSILAAQLVSKICETMGIQCSIVRLLHNTTIASLANWLDSPEAVAGSQASLIYKAETGPESVLSFGEQRIWFLTQLLQDSAIYLTPAVFHLEGALDVTALERSIRTVVERHETLRTAFRSRHGLPVRVISQVPSTVLAIYDVSDLPAGQRLPRSLQLALKHVHEPFDVARDPMLRVTLFNMGEQDHLLLVTMHHIVSDAWSRRVLYQEITACYEASVGGGPPKLQTLPIQYSDYARWQREWLQREVLESEESYWKQRLAGLTVLELPTDRPRPAQQTYRGAQEAVVLPEDLCRSLRELSRREGVTPFMTLLAAFQALLHRYTGQGDISVGTPIANRTRVETEGLIGFFVNTLVLRSDLSDDPTFAELLVRVREVTLEAYTHQDVPFEKLVEVLQPERSLSHSPLFQVMFAFNNTPSEGLALPGLNVSELDIDSGTAKFDLTLSLTDKGKEIRGFLEYSTDLFDTATARRMVGHYVRLLEEVVKNADQRVSQLSLLTERERKQLLLEWNNTTREYPQRSIHELFQEQVEQSPNAVAVVYEGQQLSYRELNERANQVAHRLRGLGVGPEVVVGICVERSLEMVIGLLGILKAGGAYLPLDPTYPQQRLQFMLADARPKIILVDRKSLKEIAAPIPLVQLEDIWKWAAGANCENLPNETGPDNLACVMYTSGSTGTPKAVEIVNRGIVRLLFGADYVRLGPTEVVLQLAPLSFDASTFEIWGALLHGARCILAPNDIPVLQNLGRLIQDHGITTLWLTASLFNTVIDEKPQVLSGVRQLLIGGEALSVTHVKRALDLLPLTELTNGYGPTESTTFTCCFRIKPQLNSGLSSIPIGRPINNTRVYVLDRQLEPAPIGLAGELYIGGDGLARGYLNRPALTAERFIPDPFSKATGARLYKTGDQARYLEDGTIEFLGRLDEQVKLRGFRIELGEIESVLRGHPQVKAVAVVTRERPGSKFLVAYVVPQEGESPSADDLRLFLQEKLPEYMVPAVFVFLDALPLTANGKLDRQALPETAVTQKTLIIPRDSVESKLAEIWENVLGTHPISVKDNFFELGGHSLLAVRLFHHIQESFNRNFPVTTIFEAPTIEDLASVLRQNGHSPSASPLVPLQIVGSNRPLFCVYGLSGNAFNYRHLACSLGRDRPVYGLHPQAEKDKPAVLSIRKLAARYVREIRAFQPNGPYHLGGHSAGGVIAFEVAQQLQAEGQTVGLLALFDAVYPGYARTLPSRYTVHEWAQKVLYHFGRFAELNPKEKFVYFRQIYRDLKMRTLEKMWRLRPRSDVFVSRPLPETVLRLQKVDRQAIRDYAPRPYQGQVTVFRGRQSPWQPYIGCDLGWSRVAVRGVEIFEVPGDHMTLLKEPNVWSLAEQLRARLDRVDASS